MAAGEKKKKKQGHECPKIDKAIFSSKFTGPAWNGESIEQANAAWAAYTRRVARLRPMPRKTRKE